MSVKLQQVSNLVNKLAPKSLALDWDNIGLQLGDYNQEVERVLVTLDINGEVLEEAIRNNIDLIIAHHPFIFKGISNIRFNTPTGEIIKEAIKNDISFYVAHTNYDIAPGALNDILAAKLDIIDCEVLKVTLDNQGETFGLGRIGYLKEETSLDDYVKLVKDKLNLSSLKVVGDKEVLIKKVALCSGSGADLIKPALYKGADLLVTGDVKYHQAQMAEEEGIALIDAGHYETEEIMRKAMAEYLTEKTSEEGLEVEIIKSQVNTNPFKIM